MTRSEAATLVRARDLGKSFAVFASPSARLRHLVWRGKTNPPVFWALRGVDLDVYAGEAVGIVGRNGSGKSTLLKLICGTLAATTGEVETRGRVAPMLTIGAGFNGEFTGRENAVLSASMLGLTESDLADRLEWIRGFADIGEFFVRPTKSYSSGMRARLAFAVAVSLEPDLIVIDEVLAVGDEAFSRKCIARLEEMRARGSAILLVSHSANLIMELCDRVLVLDEGEAVLTGIPKEAVPKYQRLLYAPKSERSLVRRALQDEEEGEAGVCELPGVTAPTGLYDPGLKSESRVEFESIGARILNPRFETADAEVVNVLRSGGTYFYRYEVEFDASCYAVRFGMMLKLSTGIEVAGQVSHPLGRGIDCVEAGTRVEVSFPLQMSFVAGTYFANAGVVGSRDEGEGYLHRIVDALAFRVEGERGSTVTGAVDLGAGGARIELRPKPGRGSTP